MACRVRIFLRHRDQIAGTYIGERWLREPPRPGKRIAVQLESSVLAGTVERIVPGSWQPSSELIPTIHVLQDVET